MTFLDDCPCGRSQIFTAFEEMALGNSHLLPDRKKVVYFVTAMQGESKKIIYVGFTPNLRKKFKDHKRKMEFEFLDRMGYQINISWMVLPEGTREKQGQVFERTMYVFLNPSSTFTKILWLPFKLKNRRNELKIWNNANMTP